MIVTTDQYKYNQLVAALTGLTLTLHLYKNNFTPLPTSVVTDFTEADFPGYVSVAVGTWSYLLPPDVDANDRATAISDPLLFTLSGDLTPAQTCYGYYITDVLGNLVWSERWGLAAVFQYNGDQIRQTPRYQLGQGF